MEYIFIAETEIIQETNEAGKVRQYSVGSVFTLAPKTHKGYKDHQVVLLNRNKNWLGLTKDEVNNHFRINLK